jgi:hypothetical protein
VRVLVHEAVARAIRAEAAGDTQTTNDLHRQAAEIPKFTAEKL